jgi:hypothetical protein
MTRGMATGECESSMSGKKSESLSCEFAAHVTRRFNEIQDMKYTSNTGSPRARMHPPNGSIDNNHSRDKRGSQFDLGVHRKKESFGLVIAPRKCVLVH